MRRVFLAALAAVILVGGCKSGAGAGAGEAGAGGADGEKGYEFVFVCPIVDNPYWVECARGIQKADEELGTRTRVVGPTDAKNYAEEIIGHMEQAVADKPDGIMAYAGIEAMAPLINRSLDEGVPFIAIDSDAPDTRRLAYVGIDPYNTGYRAGETMRELTGGTAKVGVLVTSRQARHEMAVLEGFKDFIADFDMEIAAMEATGGTFEASAQQARAMMEEHPDITALFTTGAVTVTGAAKAKEELGREDLVLAGMDDTEENLAYVRKGVIDAIFASTPYYMGYQGVHLLKEYADKGDLPKDFYEIDVVCVTRENLDTYKD